MSSREPTDLETSRDYSIVTVAFKTVEMFEGLTERKLWLKNGPIPLTNGNLIEVPFKAAEMYQLVEYQLAHILFKSDAYARKHFVAEYASSVLQSISKHAPAKAPSEASGIAAVMDLFVGTLEAERVLSLWGLVYEGSAATIRRQRHDAALTIAEAAKSEMAAYFVALANGVDYSEAKHVRFKPIFLEALERVRLRGFDATLLTAKWLLAQIVDELLKQLPPSSDGSKSSEKDGPASAQSKETKPKDGTPEERTAALLDALDELGDAEDAGGPDHDDVTVSEYLSARQKSESKALAEAALSTPVKNAQALERALDNSRAEMSSIVEKVRDTVRKKPDPDEWLRKDALARVVIRDITSKDVVTAASLSDEDRDAVKRLRTQFIRVMGKRKFQLEDIGYEVDVPALIERKITGIPTPVFRGEATGRGFRALLLLDRSQSMAGGRTKQAERSTRVLHKALDFPFVTAETWGFQSLICGQFDLTRYAPDVDQFDTERSGVGGATPLHLAIRLATRHLERVADSRHLFVVTDGSPVWGTSNGKNVPRAVLLRQVRDNVRAARAKGINVVGVMIKSDVTEDEMRFMFGSAKHWRIVSDKTFARDLVHLVSSSFVEYLKFA